MKNLKEAAAIVPNAWNEIKKRHEKNLAEDKTYRKAFEQIKARGIRSRAKAFQTGGKPLEELREIPGFNESAERALNAMQYAILDARKRSGLKQTEIAQRMKVPQANVSRIEHSTDAMTFKTFAAYLKACGYSFSITLQKL
jgi:ribosome-binding protein aMBF1 (putative translation factor)